MKNLHPLRSICVSSILTFLATSAHAQFVLTGATYTQDFDALGATGTDLSVIPGWFVGTGAGAISGTTVTASTGSTTTAGNYSFGSAGSTDRALGSLAGSGTQRDTEFRFTNNTGQNITALSILYDGEQWRVGGSTVVNNQLTLQFSIDGMTFTTLGANFNFDTPIDTAASGGALDGNAPANRVADIGGLYTLGSALTVGQTAYLRWMDLDNTSNDHAISLDNLRLTATLVVAGRNILWSPITGAWDTTSMHWNDGAGATAFQNGDDVTFDDSGLALGSTVTVQAAGVTVGSMKVTNTTGTYTFVGGAISGSGSITKTGAGKLVLSVPNTYTGSTIVTEGVVSISDDAQLGSATAPLSLGTAGTLETTGSLTLNSARPVSGTGTINIAPSTTLDIAGPTNAGALTLSNTGSLRFSGAASAQVGGFSVQRGINISTVQPLLLNGPFNTTNPDDTVTMTGPLGLGTATRIFTIADGTALIDASIAGAISSGSSSGRLHKLGDGALALLGDNSGLTGGVQLGTAGSTPANGGTLIVNSSTSLGPGGAGSAGQFRFNPGTLRATQAIQFPATLSASIGNGAPFASTFSGSDIDFLGPVWFFRTTTAPQLPVGHIIVAESNVRFAAPFANPTAANLTSDLTIRGAGSVTFAAGGTWTGDVFIDGGKLFISGNVLGSVTPDARPAFNAGTGGLLGGNVSGSDSLGSITASGSAGIPGIISPGTPLDTTGVITTTSLTVLPDGLLAMNLGGVVDGEFDQIVVNGSAYIRGQLSLSLVGGFIPPLGQTFTLILNDGADQQQPDDLFIGKAEDSTFMADGYEFRINYNAGIDANDVVLTVVPEPGSIALLLGGLGFLGLSRRRRS